MSPLRVNPSYNHQVCQWLDTMINTLLRNFRGHRTAPKTSQISSNLFDDVFSDSIQGLWSKLSLRII